MRFWVSVIIWGLSSAASAISLSAADSILAALTNATIAEGNYQIEEQTRPGAADNSLEISKPRSLLLKTKEMGQVLVSYGFSETGMRLQVRNDLGLEMEIRGADAEAIHQRILTLIRTQRLAHSSLALSYYAYTQLDSAALFDGALITQISYRLQTEKSGRATIAGAVGFELVNGRGEILQIHSQPAENQETKLVVQVTHPDHVTQAVPLSSKANAKLLSLLMERAEYFQRFYAAENDANQFFPARQNEKPGFAHKIFPKFMGRFFSAASNLPETIAVQLIPAWEINNDQSGRELAWKKSYQLGSFSPKLCARIYQGL